MADLKSIRELQPDMLAGKRVLVRVGFDVPVQDGKVVDDFRIRETLPTLLYLRDRGAKVILLSHLGRDGVSQKPVCDALGLLTNVLWCPALLGSDVVETISTLKDGDMIMLENMRADDREEKNDEGFARELAALGDIYVNEAFSVAHRAHASIVGIPQFLPSYAGFQFEKEITELKKAMTPTSPSLFILGGAKFETKLPLVKKMLELYDHIFVGGALAHDIWKARGVHVGKSLVSDVPVDPALAQNEKIILPIDVVAVNEEGGVRTIPVGELNESERILDCGPQTVARIADLSRDAGIVLWNGPLGSYEKGYIDGTRDAASVVAQSKGHTVIGGGDTVAAIQSLALTDKFTFISTGGGAMLAYLEAGTLPGIEALER